MEHKLFYQDPYIHSFSSTVKKQEKDETGNWYVVLEQTAFYPTGGGQPFDKGTINDISVINVEEINDEIRHYIDSPLLESDVRVDCQIDWVRRFDHMQQHAGQHILSAAFEEVYSYGTVSFHLGQEMLTIDIDTEELTHLEASKVERRANQIILENRPIEIKWITESELSQFPLRKKPSVTENIRLVIIPNYDYNGCGGTHPKSTGEVLAIKILDWERQKKKTRVRFVCGDRVLQQLHEKHRIMSLLTRKLNAPEHGLELAVERLIENAKSIEKQLEEARQTLLQYESREMIHNQVKQNEKIIIGKVLQNRTMKDLQQLARLITNEVKEVIVLLVSENDDQLQIVAARGSGLNISMKEWLGKILATINGKGGGNDVMAQGGGDLVVSGKQLMELSLEEVTS